MNLYNQKSICDQKQDDSCYYDEHKILDLRKEFETLSVQQILTRSIEEFGENLMMTTSFGYGGMVLLHFIRDISSELPIYFINTRYLFKETLQFAEKIKNEWNLNINTLETKYSEEDLEELLGPDAYKNNVDECCYYRKVKPLLEVIRPETVWISSVRKDQAQLKSRRHVVAIDGRGNVKINPLCNWTKNQVWAYIKENDIPYNPLYDQNYPSIGCKPCTDQVFSGEERDGRWKGKNKIECGLHTYKD